MMDKFIGGVQGFFIGMAVGAIGITNTGRARNEMGNRRFSLHFKFIKDTLIHYFLGMYDEHKRHPADTDEKAVAAGEHLRDGVRYAIDTSGGSCPAEHKDRVFGKVKEGFNK